MIKNYIEEKINNEPETPSEKTIRFILDYSKSLHVLKMNKSKDQVELNLN